MYSLYALFLIILLTIFYQIYVKLFRILIFFIAASTHIAYDTRGLNEKYIVTTYIKIFQAPFSISKSDLY